jgi:hypothetical protein
MVCISVCHHQVVLEWAVELREDADQEEDAKAVLTMSEKLIAHLEQAELEEEESSD